MFDKLEVASDPEGIVEALESLDPLDAPQSLIMSFLDAANAEAEVSKVVQKERRARRRARSEGKAPGNPLVTGEEMKRRSMTRSRSTERLPKSRSVDAHRRKQPPSRAANPYEVGWFVGSMKLTNNL